MFFLDPVRLLQRDTLEFRSLIFFNAFWEKGEKQCQEGPEYMRTQPRPTHLTIPIVCSPIRGLNKNPQKIVNRNFQILHGLL